MLKSPFLFAISVLVMLMQWTGSARAQAPSMGLSFELPPANSQATIKHSELQTPVIELPAVEAPAKKSPATQPPVVEIASTLPLQSVSSERAPSLEYSKEDLPPITIPIGTAAQPQVDVSSAQVAPTEEIATENNSNNSSEIGLSFAAHTISEETLVAEPTETPNAPTNPLSGDSLQGFSLESSEFETAGFDPSETDRSVADSPALLFAETTIEVPSLSEQVSTTTKPRSTQSRPTQSFSINAMGLGDWIFENGTESLVARTVGSAEGTRHWDGRKTQAYYGHVDPGNGVWNLGTFSYQHDAQDPADADEKQLRRLQRQGVELETQANRFGIQLSLEEKLNGLDLANQAPLAALDKGGYIERLAQAHRLQMAGEEAILWARTHSYMDPDTRRWNAPGLGNNVNSISKDQERRIHAISKAMTAFEPAGSNSVALDHLEEITLENAGIAANPEINGDALASTSDRLTFSNMEVSFGLPPADQALIAALSVPAEPIAETVEKEVLTASVAVTEKNTIATSAELENSGLGVGVDFLASDDIAIGSANVAQTVTTESAETLEPSETDAAVTEGERLEAVSDSDLFSLRSQDQTAPSLTDRTEPNNIEPNNIEPDDTQPDSTAPEEVATTAATNQPNRLQSLLNGIIPPNQPTREAIEKTTEATNEPSEPSQSFLRTEDKIVDKK